jgi:hypothetical protein
MATLTTQVINRAGVVVTPVAAAGGGDAMSCGSGMMLEVVNGGGSPITVTLAIPSGASGYANAAYTSTAVSVTNGTTKWIGRSPPRCTRIPRPASARSPTAASRR